MGTTARQIPGWCGDFERLYCAGSFTTRLWMESLT
jgi:hypothetical protein